MHEKKVDGVEEVMETASTAAEQSTSVLSYIRNKRKLLDEFAFAEPRLKNGKYKKRWEKQIEMINRALGDADENES